MSIDNIAEPMIADELALCWSRMCEQIAGAFRFTEAEAAGFEANKIARLIGALPYLAGADDPDRTAAAHLATFVVSCRMREVANARPSDDGDPMKRLSMLDTFVGGDPAVIRRGMNLIALCMLADYRRDVAEDEAAGKHNPLVTGAWDYEETKNRLVREIEHVPCEAMDRILDVEWALGWGFWEL